jgi:hypothetical protein
MSNNPYKKVIDLTFTPIDKDYQNTLDTNLIDKYGNTVDFTKKIEEIAEYVSTELNKKDNNVMHDLASPLFLKIIRYAAIKFPYTILPIIVNQSHNNISALIYLMSIAFLLSKDLQENELKFKTTYQPIDENIKTKSTTGIMLLSAWMKIFEEYDITFDQMLEKMIQEGLIDKKDIIWMGEELQNIEVKKTSN